jgi:hypothetical protein
MELSHESKILEIDDIELDCMNNDGNKVKVGYKEPNNNEVLVELIGVSRKNSFVYIKEDED